MSANKIFTIYGKEIRDLLRDRRTIVTSILLPIVFYPIIMIVFSSLMMRQEKKLGEETVRIYIHDTVKDSLSGHISSVIAADSLMDIYPKDRFTEDNPSLLTEADFRARLNDRFFQTVMIVRKEETDSLGNDRKYPIYSARLIYDKADDRSSRAYEKITDMLVDAERQLIGKRLSAIEVSPEILEAVTVQSDNIASSQRMLGLVVGRLLPYLLIILTVSSGAVIATDLIAGEKERGTLETLLVSAASRTEIVIGKYLTVMTFQFVSVIMNLFSMYLSIKHLMTQAGLDMADMQLPISSFSLVFLAMIPLITLISGVLVSISTYSRNMREANTYLSPVIMITILMSFVSMLPGVELNVGFSMIPVINIALLFKEIMLDQFSMINFLVTIGSTLVLDMLMIVLTVKLFNREGILFRVEEEKTLKFWGKNKKNIFQPGLALMIFAAQLVALFYIGSIWQAKDPAMGLAKTLLFLFLIPILLILRVGKVNIKETFRFTGTNPLNFLLVMLMSLPTYLFASKVIELINLLYPIPEQYISRFSEMMSMNDASLWMKILVVAVLPGICEETVYRGYMFRVFRKFGIPAAVVISSVMFGIMHLDPFRLLPATLLGMWIAFLMIRTGSFYIAMLAHFMNNLIVVMLLQYGEAIPGFSLIFRNDQIAWPALAAMVVIFGGLLYGFMRINPGIAPGFKEIDKGE